MSRLVIWAALLGLIGCGGGSTPLAESAYRIARDPSWFPFNLGGQGTSVLAFSDDLLGTIAKQEDFRIALLPTSWETIPVLLKQGRADGVLTSIPPIPQYRALYDFSDVYLYLGPVLIVPEESKASTLQDMRGKTIGVLAGSSSMLLVAKIPEMVVKDYMNLGLALEDLLHGKIDAVVMAALPAYAYMGDFYSGQLKVATPPLTDAGLRLLVQKGTHEELIEKFNAGLKTMVEKSEYEQIAEKWRLNLQLGPSPFHGDHTALLDLLELSSPR